MSLPDCNFCTDRLHWACRPALSLTTAILHKKCREQYSASGVRGGPGPTFAQHLASADGKKELRKLRAHVDKQVQAELGASWKPGKRTPGSFHHCSRARLGGPVQVRVVACFVGKQHTSPLMPTKVACLQKSQVTDSRSRRRPAAPPPPRAPLQRPRPLLRPRVASGPCFCRLGSYDGGSTAVLGASSASAVPRAANSDCNAACGGSRSGSARRRPCWHAACSPRHRGRVTARVR